MRCRRGRPWPAKAGELEQAVETTAEQDWCDACGVAAVAHGRRLVQVRNLPSAGRPVTLLWVKRLWRCPEPACCRRTWTERSEHVRASIVSTTLTKHSRIYTTTRDVIPC